jgi:hypothetical protein
MMNFFEVWEVAKDFRGWLQIDEAFGLWSAAKLLRRESTMVELGCYCGKSTAFLGTVARDRKHHFYTVDDFSTAETEREFRDNMALVDAHCELVRGKSTEVLNKLPPIIDFLFIDTIHTYEQCSKELSLYLPKMPVGSIVCFHDFGGQFVGITKAVNEQIENGVLERVGVLYSLMVARVISPYTKGAQS